MHWWWNQGWSWWNWALMTVGMVGFWGLIVWAVVSLVRSTDRSQGEARRSPEQILAERFAAGEIDNDDYRERLNALRSTKTASR